MSIIIKYEEIDGILDIKQIYKGNGLNKTYFISGLQIMVSSFKATLLNLGLDEN
jgi:hypothetical protein